MFKTKVFYGRVLHHNNLTPFVAPRDSCLLVLTEFLESVLLGFGDVWRQLEIRFLHQALKIRPKALDCFLRLHVCPRWLFSVVMERARLVELIRDGRLGCRRRHGTLPSKVIGKSSRFHLNDVLQLVREILSGVATKLGPFARIEIVGFDRLIPSSTLTLSSREAFKSLDERAGRNLCCSSFSNFLTTVILQIFGVV